MDWMDGWNGHRWLDAWMVPPAWRAMDVMQGEVGTGINCRPTRLSQLGICQLGPFNLPSRAMVEVTNKPIRFIISRYLT